jgi:hypothetical protein
MLSTAGPKPGFKVYPFIFQSFLLSLSDRIGGSLKVFHTNSLPIQAKN